MLALLSPAKKLDFDPPVLPLPHTQPAFLEETAILVETARGLSRADLSRLMDISPSLADMNYERFRSFSTPFTPQNAKQAVLAFAGDTYIGLEASTLGVEDLTWAQDHLGILSGLYGLLRPFDLIQPYRLEMGTRMANPRGNDLYDFWGARLAQAAEAAVAGHASPVIVNLASTEYFKAVGAKRLSVPLITPVFKEVKGGQAKVIGLMAKRARGMMARFMIENRIDEPEALKDFCASGYRFRADLSNGKEWVFLRDHDLQESLSEKEVMLA
ncbi:peroxide stress protein YaaA [Telmatospirillum sp. J64-1]|uniref:peroxide stress protein YaaA n=1 Tax=Telmatospirillum sp. J64-1 TaxID=2502183 RepID=UPI00115E7FCA|nr:peroxide stress protein YaaA [Telmatospirillum sp. J64-1]